MLEVCLEKYIGKDWSNYKDYTSILGTTMKRKYKYARPVSCEIEGDLSDLQKLSLKRASSCISIFEKRELYNKSLSLHDRIPLRSYKHNLYEYDDMNELERFGTGEYARKYIVLVSFEDSLDFIYGNILKTKSNSLIKFCEKNNLNYKLYSRQVLGGGVVRELLMNDLLGFSESYDVILRNIGNKNSLERMLFSTRFNKFCINLRNSLVVECGSKLRYYDDIVLASIGMSSLLYYSNDFINEDIRVVNKSYDVVLKSLCYERNDYLNVIEDSLSYW